MRKVARGVAESNSSFLSAFQTSCVLHISMNAQLTYEPIVNWNFISASKDCWGRGRDETEFIQIRSGQNEV